MRFLVIILALCYSVVASGQNIPRLPHVALKLALEDQKGIVDVPNVINKGFCRYIWNFDGSTDTYAAVTFVVNSVINQSSQEVFPEIIADGAIIRLNFLNLADTIEEATKNLNLWDSMASSDPYFSLTINQVSKDKKTSVKTVIPAPYLGVVFTPGLVYRSDWLVSILTQAVDGGFYYKFQHIEPGKTKLDDYLAANGASTKNAIIEASVISSSKVTGKPRKVKYWYGQKVKPTTGRPLVIITEDIFDGNVDPNSNPFSSLLGNKPDGKELFLKATNGYWKFSLWNGQDTAVAEAPPNLVQDHKIPQPFTHRLQPGISCIRCHSDSSMIQEFHNDIYSMINGPGIVFGDYEARRQILNEFGAPELDISNLIKDERQAIDTRTFSSTRLIKNRFNAKQSGIAVTEVFNHYNYDIINPKLALEDIGLEVEKNDETGIKSFKKLITPSVPDLPFIIQLMTEWTDPETKIQHTGELRRQEFEQVYQVLMKRAEPSINELLKKDNK